MIAVLLDIISSFNAVHVGFLHLSWSLLSSSSFVTSHILSRNNDILPPANRTRSHKHHPSRRTYIASPSPSTFLSLAMLSHVLSNGNRNNNDFLFIPYYRNICYSPNCKDASRSELISYCCCCRLNRC